MNGTRSALEHIERMIIQSDELDIEYAIWYIDLVTANIDELYSVCEYTPAKMYPVINRMRDYAVRSGKFEVGSARFRKFSLYIAIAVPNAKYNDENKN